MDFFLKKRCNQTFNNAVLYRILNHTFQLCCVKMLVPQNKVK